MQAVVATSAIGVRREKWLTADLRGGDAARAASPTATEMNLPA